MVSIWAPGSRYLRPKSTRDLSFRARAGGPASVPREGAERRRPWRRGGRWENSALVAPINVIWRICLAAGVCKVKRIPTPHLRRKAGAEKQESSFAAVIRKRIPQRRSCAEVKHNRKENEVHQIVSCMNKSNVEVLINGKASPISCTHTCLF